MLCTVHSKQIKHWKLVNHWNNLTRQRVILVRTSMPSVAQSIDFFFYTNMPVCRSEYSNWFIRFIWKRQVWKNSTSFLLISCLDALFHSKGRGNVNPRQNPLRSKLECVYYRKGFLGHSHLKWQLSKANDLHTLVFWFVMNTEWCKSSL